MVTGGDSSSHSFSLIGGSLPSGVRIDSASGALEGTPTESGTFTYVLGVADRHGATQNQTLSVTVRQPCGLRPSHDMQIAAGQASSSSRAPLLIAGLALLGVLVLLVALLIVRRVRQRAGTSYTDCDADFCCRAGEF